MEGLTLNLMIVDLASWLSMDIPFPPGTGTRHPIVVAVDCCHLRPFVDRLGFSDTGTAADRGKLAGLVA